jgi:hypothetical protein
VKVDAARKTKSEAELLDQATGQMLRAIKQKMIKKQGRVDYSKLRKEGYSERFLARLDLAFCPTRTTWPAGTCLGGG